MPSLHYGGQEVMEKHSHMFRKQEEDIARAICAGPTPKQQACDTFLHEAAGAILMEQPVVADTGERITSLANSHSDADNSMLEEAEATGDAAWDWVIRNRLRGFRA